MAAEEANRPLISPDFPVSGLLSTQRSPFTWDVIATIIVFYGIAALIIGTQIGPWEVVRAVGLNGVIVLAWMISTHYLLRNQAISYKETVRYSQLELIAGLAILAIIVIMVVNLYTDWVSLSTWGFYGIWYGLLAAFYLGLRISPRALGLRWPSRRGWAVLLIVILINALVGALAQFLPQGELDQPVGSGDLSQSLTGPWAVIVLIIGLLFRAAVPEELLLRVTLQPRLAQFMPLGWAILIQALLFSMGHLPQKLMQNELTPLMAIAYTLTLDNGLIAGYLWHRQRSLPLLLLLHLFAFPRFGL